MNAFSGVLLLIAYPTKALTNPVFYLKLVLIAGGLLIANIVRQYLTSGSIGAGETAPPRLRMLAVASLVVWALSITAGRLLAYTCTRLSVYSPC